MGRKGLYADKPVKGPGRKAKKQGAPQLKKQFKGMHFLAFIKILHVRTYAVCVPSS